MHSRKASPWSQFKGLNEYRMLLLSYYWQLGRPCLWTPFCNCSVGHTSVTGLNSRYWPPHSKPFMDLVHHISRTVSPSLYSAMKASFITAEPVAAAIVQIGTINNGQYTCIHCSAPTSWNSLPDEIRKALILLVFHKTCKIELFGRAF